MNINHRVTEKEEDRIRRGEESSERINENWHR
jgi:hypothetical protein